MIDLKELERRLDEALEKETPESLSAWLLNQRKDNLESFLGIGHFMELKENPYSFRSEFHTDNVYTCKNENNNPSECLDKAA